MIEHTMYHVSWYWYCFDRTVIFELLTWCLVVVLNVVDSVWYCLTWLLQLSGYKTAVVPRADCIGEGWIVTNRYFNRQTGSPVKIFLIYLNQFETLQQMNPKYNSVQSCLCFVNQVWISNRWTISFSCLQVSDSSKAMLRKYPLSLQRSTCLNCKNRRKNSKMRRTEFAKWCKRVSEIHNCFVLSFIRREIYIIAFGRITMSDKCHCNHELNEGNLFPPQREIVLFSRSIRRKQSQWYDDMLLLLLHC